MNLKTIISITAGFVLSAIGFYYAFANVPFDELVWYLGTVNYIWILPAAALGLFTFFIRALRWHVILGTSIRLPFSSVYHAIMIGFMINSVLPARAGEVVRPAILKKQEQVPFSHGVTTLITERILDAITLIALFVWMIGTVNIDPDLEVEVLGYQLSLAVLEGAASTMIVVSLVLGSLVVVMSIPAFQRLLKAGVMRIPDLFVFSSESFKEKIHDKLCATLIEIIDNIVAGMSIVKFPKKLIICILYSSMIWLLQAVAFYITALGAPSIDLTFTQMTIVFVIICFFIILPSVPGFWGIWEAGGVFGLALFEVGAREALGFSLTIHAVLMFPVLLAGIVSLGITGREILRDTI